MLVSFLVGFGWGAAFSGVACIAVYVVRSARAIPGDFD